MEIYVYQKELHGIAMNRPREIKLSTTHPFKRNSSQNQNINQDQILNMLNTGYIPYVHSLSQSHITIIFPIWTWLCRLRLLEFMPVAAWGPSDSDRWPAIWSHGPFTVLGTCFPCFPLCLLMIYDGLSWIYRCWFSMVFFLHGCVGHYTNPARFSLW